MDPNVLDQLVISGPQDETVLTTAVSIRFRKQDAELLRDEATKRGFTTTVGFARSLILAGLARYDERSLLLETILRVESVLFEYFKAVSPKEEESGLQRIREKADAMSVEILKSFVDRRSRKVEMGGETSGS